MSAGDGSLLNGTISLDCPDVSISVCLMLALLPEVMTESATICSGLNS